MKKKQSLINLLSCILVIMVIGIIINSNKFTSKYMTSNKYFNLLNNSVDTDDIVELIENLKTSNNTKKEEVKALSNRVKALSSNTIGSADALNKIYPIGSIYISTTLTNITQVHNALGGTWEVYGAGKVLKGTTNSNDVGTSNSATGSVTLATGNLPSHSHTMAHTHTFTPAGTNSYTTKNVTTGNQSADHTHTLAERTATSSTNGAHAHSDNVDNYLMHHTTNAPEVSSGGLCPGGLWGGMALKLRGVYYSSYAGEHTHAVSLAAVTTGNNSANHTHTITNANLKTGIGTITFTGTKKASGDSSQANTSSTGKGSDIQAFSVIDSYITVYMYRRTA